MTSQSEKVAELPVKPPQVLQKAHQPGKTNPLTPALRTPKDSPIVKAIYDADPRLKRFHLKDIVRPETWAVIEPMGEVNYDGDPLVECINAMHVFMAINYERKVYDNTHPILIKSEGAESANFDHFSERSGVELEK